MSKGSRAWLFHQSRSEPSKAMAASCRRPFRPSRRTPASGRSRVAGPRRTRRPPLHSHRSRRSWGLSSRMLVCSQWFTTIPDLTRCTRWTRASTRISRRVIRKASRSVTWGRTSRSLCPNRPRGVPRGARRSCRDSWPVSNPCTAVSAVYHSATSSIRLFGMRSMASESHRLSSITSRSARRFCHARLRAGDSAGRKQAQPPRPATSSSRKSWPGP